MKIRALLLAAAVALLANAAFAADASSTKDEQSHVIAFNYGAPTAVYNALYVAQDLGLFEKHGLKPTFFNFQSGAPLLAGLKSGSLDVVTTGLASVFALGQGIPIKYLVWEGQAAMTEGLVTSKNAGIKSFKELGKLKKIAAPTGTCAQVSLFQAAKAVGIEYSKLDVVNIAPPLYRNALESGSIDGGIAWAPYSMALASEGYPLVGVDTDWIPGGGACPEMTLARPAALKKYPELGMRLIAVHAEAVKAIQNDPKLAIKAITERLRTTPEVAAEIVRRYFQNYPTLEMQLDPNSSFAMVGDKGLVAQLDLASKSFAALGVLKQPIPIKTLRDAVDPEYIKAYLETRQK